MLPIRATYRLQLSPAFDFGAATALVPYLDRLGVSHVHCSPVYEARPGSTHGYDVVDPGAVRTALGGRSALDALLESLRGRGMGAVLDVVPNHMAAHAANRRWMELLSHGPAASAARWFDVNWRAGPAGEPRVLVPVLGDRLGTVLEGDDLHLVWEEGRVRLAYWEHRFPLDPSTLVPLLGDVARGCEERLSPDDGRCAELREIAALLRRLPGRGAREPRALARRRGGAEAARERLAALAEECADVRDAIDEAVRSFTGPGGRARLRRLLEAQPYALAHWRRAARELNYRRFFDVNDLVALHMENPEVFREHHALLRELVQAGGVDGLRVDHPDGLLDPLEYLRRLVDATMPWRPDARYPIFVEKILAHGERLRDTWPVAGTTGYDFLNDAEALFVDPAGVARLDADYRRIARRRADYAAAARDGKRLALETALSAGVRQLAARWRAELPDLQLSQTELETALEETIVALPVYRTYVDGLAPQGDAEDRALLAAALADARRAGRARPAALDAVEAVLLGGNGSDAQSSARLRLRQRFQQLSGPAAAKGVEDTAAYVYAPLLSRNEVGGSPEVMPDAAVARFHAANLHRRARWPHTMVAVTTHDTKRSADVRARLDVLSELPGEWEAHLYRWRRWNRVHRRKVRGRRAPDAATEYLLYQTLVGAWPLDGLDPARPVLPDERCLATLRDRFTGYVIKASREAKERTTWLDPDEDYEASLAGFVAALLDPARSGRFLADLVAFTARLARPGLWNALARTVLFLTAPGIPDIYQGDELWNFSLVDPDNRRPVDFAWRAAMLDALIAAGEPSDTALAVMLAVPEDGRLKLHVTRAALALRRRDPALFLDGSYEPLDLEGPRAAHAVAFLRRLGDRVLIVVAPRLVLPLLSPALRLDPRAWESTAVLLPAGIGGGFERPLGGGPVHPMGDWLPLDAVLAPLPVAVLVSGAAPAPEV